jgi:hypothetical protein
VFHLVDPGVLFQLESFGNKEPNVTDNVCRLLMEEIERFHSLMLVYHFETDSSSEIDE